MGDRANIYVEMPTEYGKDAPKAGVYLYTHWSGMEWPELLRKALDFGEGRWDDDIYLARIITSRVFKDQVESTTGGGLSLIMGDNEHPIIVVELESQTVAFAREGNEKTSALRYGRMSFADYVAQEQADYPSTDED